MEGKLALIVSTDISIQNLLADILSAEGCEVQTAETVAEASSLLEDFNFDLMTVNQKLNDGNLGSDLINETKKSHPEMKTILLSSNPRPSNFNADGFMMKPLKIDKFINMARSLTSID